MFSDAANPNLIPIQMCSSTIEYDQFSPGWTLAQVCDTEEPRTFIGSVIFDTAFYNIPIVHVGLTGLDIDQRDSARISVKPEMITSTGFDIRIKTWHDTRVYKAEISWIALGQ